MPKKPGYNRRSRVIKAKKAANVRWSIENQTNNTMEMENETKLEGDVSYESLNFEENDGNMIEEKPMITKVDASTNTEFCVIDCDLATLLKQTRKNKYSQRFQCSQNNHDEEESFLFQNKKPKNPLLISELKGSENEDLIIYKKDFIPNDSHDEEIKNEELNESMDLLSLETSEELYKISKSKNINALSGSRLIPIEKLKHFLDSYAFHCLYCKQPPRFTEEYQCGLFINLQFKCYICKQDLILCNSKQLFDETQEFYAINLCSVLGSLSTGLGYAAMNEIFSLIDVRYLNENQYKKNQNKLSNIIQKEVNQSLQKNFQVEESIAVDNGNFDGGFPTISCVGDARWSKRSYNFNYTANSSTAVLIGSNTKKIVYIGVKNKYCKLCQVELKKNERKIHKCGKNWKGPSTSMEAALILEGFIELEKKRIRVLHYTGDQDSSVIKTIIRHFEWGNRVVKIDCINHKIRNFTTYLLAWKKKHGLERIFPVKMVQHFKALVRKLINEKSTDKDYFIKHILITFDHLLGSHEKCDKFYCHSDYIFPKIQISNLAYKEMQEYLTRITNRVDRLREGVTSNLAECFFSIVCKFDHGKIKNFIQGNSYELRSLCAALSYNEGPLWNYQIIKNYFGMDSLIMRSYFDRKNMLFTMHKKHKQTSEYKDKRKERKLKNSKNDENNDYGIYADEDDNEEEIWKKCANYYEKRILTDIETADFIEHSTQDQANSVL